MNIRSNLLFEHLDRSSLEAARLEPDTCMRVEDLTNGGGEVFREAWQMDFDLLVNDEGAICPGVILRDGNGEAYCAKLVDHMEGSDIGRRLFTAALSGLFRLEQSGLLEEPGSALKLAEKQLNRLLYDVPGDIRKALIEQLRLEVMLSEGPERAVALEGARAAGKRQAQKEHREQVMQLARAAAAVDSDTRKSMLRDLKPWLAEVAASGS